MEQILLEHQDSGATGSKKAGRFCLGCQVWGGGYSTREGLVGLRKGEEGPSGQGRQGRLSPCLRHFYQTPGPRAPGFLANVMF